MINLWINDVYDIKRKRKKLNWHQSRRKYTDDCTLLLRNEASALIWREAHKVKNFFMEMSIGFLMRYVWSHGFEKQNCHESTCEEGAERGAGRRGGGGTSPQKIQTALQQNE